MRRLSWSDFGQALTETAATSAMIFGVLLGAEVFNAFLALTQMTGAAAEMIGALSISPYAIMAILMVFYILLGGIMDELAMMLLTIPAIFPIINALDFGIPKDEIGIWFEILVLTVVGIGLIAPPIGLGVFIVTSITRDVSIVQVYKRILPFVAADFIRLGVLTAFPSVTLFLVRICKLTGRLL